MYELNRFPDFETSLFSGVVVVTGTGRSGTTEISKLISSAHNTIYVNEPHIVTLICESGSDTNKRHLDNLQIKQLLHTYLFWSEVVPQASGRTINLNPFDQTSIRSYKSNEYLQELRSKSWRFDELRENFKMTNIVMKFVDNPNIYQKLKNGLGEAINVAIIRHPATVAQSAMNRNYYSSPRLVINHQPFLRRNGNGSALPIFVTNELEESWLLGSQIDRCLIASITFLEELILNRPNHLIKYEDVSKGNGRVILDLMKTLNLMPTFKTKECIENFFPEKTILDVKPENANSDLYERAIEAWRQISIS